MLTKTMRCPVCQSSDVIDGLTKYKSDHQFYICNQCGKWFTQMASSGKWEQSHASLTDDPVFAELMRDYMNMSVLSSLKPRQEQAEKLASYIEAWIYDNLPNFKHHQE